jgi:hypothetical protein
MRSAKKRTAAAVHDGRVVVFKQMNRKNRKEAIHVRQQ